MRALVIYETIYGNTEGVARAVAEGLAKAGEVDVVAVDRAAAVVPPSVDLVVVGGPTHAFGLSRSTTRADAVKDGRPGSATVEVGLREWIAALQRPTTSPAFAAFDTKARRPPVPGSAARAASRRLRRLGFRPVGRPTSFHVDGVTGPLSAGELERAKRWGAGLVDGLHRPRRRKLRLPHVPFTRREEAAAAA